MGTRRNFLSTLATLPLIGGSVALVGAPTASAVPVTEALMKRYLTFLASEHQSVAMELLIAQAKTEDEMRFILKSKAPIRWNPGDPVVHAVMTNGEPSSRASVVLSAAGISIS